MLSEAVSTLCRVAKSDGWRELTETPASTHPVIDEAGDSRHLFDL